MLKVLFIAGIPVACGQFYCFQAAPDGNSCPPGCTWLPGTCYRNSFVNPNITLCSTDFQTCETGNNCAAGTTVVKAETCSTCRDTCYSYTTNATCVSDTNQGRCAWAPSICYNSTAPISPPCPSTTKAACTAEPGCFWYSVTATQCGVSNTISRCSQCNASLWTNSIRSGLKNKMGSTCTWPLAAPYVSAFSLKINDIALSSDVAQCPAFSPPTSADEPAVSVLVQTGIFSAGSPFSVNSAANPNCGGVCSFDAAGVCPLGCVETPGSCYRKVGACSTSSTVCDTSNSCVVGSTVTKAETCSRCTDGCASFKDNATCLSDTNRAQCGWLPASCLNATTAPPTPTPPTPCSGTEKAACTGEAGCFWYSVTSTQCGASNTISSCASCSSSIWSTTARSAFKNNVGKTCSWSQAVPYVSAFSLKINDIELSSDVALCPPFSSADDVAIGVVTQLGLFSAGVPFSATTSLDAAACAQLDVNSATSFVPGLTILGFVALLA